MAIRILLDEDSQAKALIQKLRVAGHDVLTIQEARMNGDLDPDVLAFAIRENRVLITRNGADFRALHAEIKTHPGIVIIHRQAVQSKNLSFDGIVNALANLEASGVPIKNEIHALESWSF